MIDLHIHTTYSDGTDSVIDVLKKAEKLGLKAIAITDHENCDAYKELAKIDVGKYFSGKVLHGIELKARYTDRVIDVLGYNIDCEKMERYLKECYGNVTREQIQESQLRKFYEYKDEYGLVMSGGSDYHGLHKPDIEMGSGKGQLCIPDEIYEKIIEK